jgi:hypothetical protein
MTVDDIELRGIRRWEAIRLRTGCKRAAALAYAIGRIQTRSPQISLSPEPGYLPSWR